MLLRLHSTSRNSISVATELFNGLRSKSVSAPCEAHRFRHTDFGELFLDHLELFSEPGSVLVLAEIGMGPAMVSNFEPHPVDLSRLLPGQEIRCIFHPGLGNEEGRLKPQLL